MSKWLNKWSCDYDRDNDVLYIVFTNNDNSYGDEVIDNVILMKNIDTGNVTGITIIDAMYYGNLAIKLCSIVTAGVIMYCIKVLQEHQQSCN